MTSELAEEPAGSTRPRVVEAERRSGPSLASPARPGAEPMRPIEGITTAGEYGRFAAAGGVRAYPGGTEVGPLLRGLAKQRLRHLRDEL